MLDRVNPPLGAKDAITSSFFWGMFLSLSVAIGVLLFVPGDVAFRSEALYAIVPVFRFTLILDVCLFGAALCVRIFRKYGINYTYVFQLDPNYRLREVQLEKLAIALLFMWLLCLFLQVATYKLDFMPTHTSIFAFALFLALIVFVVSPVRVFYREARFELLKTLWHVVVSPLSDVRFKDFFMADILCSLVKPLQDLCACVCFFSTDEWIEDVEAGCGWLPLAIILMGMMPFYWRFMQCLKRYRETKAAFPYLLNAGKYFSSIFVSILNIIKYTYNYSLVRLYVASYIVTTLYSYIWDIAVDWGLLRVRPKRVFLRDTITFQAKYYYFAMVSNLFLRFAWTLTLFTDISYHQTKPGIHAIIFLLSFFEVLRRIQWSIFRVEKECISNTERYRGLLEVPQIWEEGRVY